MKNSWKWIYGFSAFIAIAILVVGFYFKKQLDLHIESANKISVFDMAGNKTEIELPERTCEKECSLDEEKTNKEFSDKCLRKGFKAFVGRCCNRVCTGNIVQGSVDQTEIRCITSKRAKGIEACTWIVIFKNGIEMKMSARGKVPNCALVAGQCQDLQANAKGRFDYKDSVFIVESAELK